MHSWPTNRWAVPSRTTCAASRGFEPGLTLTAKAATIRLRAHRIAGLLCCYAWGACTSVAGLEDLSFAPSGGAGGTATGGSAGAGAAAGGAGAGGGADADIIDDFEDGVVDSVLWNPWGLRNPNALRLRPAGGDRAGRGELRHKIQYAISCCLTCAGSCSTATVETEPA